MPHALSRLMPPLVPARIDSTAEQGSPSRSIRGDLPTLSQPYTSLLQDAMNIAADLAADARRSLEYIRPGQRPLELRSGNARPQIPESPTGTILATSI